MYYLFLLLVAAFASIPIASAQSGLLESVKRNPQEAISLCQRFKNLNSKGISTSSNQVIDEISRKKNLNSIDAEILSIYVIAMHCPEIY